MSSRESNLSYDATKDEMNSMASNGVWDLVELPNGLKAIVVNGYITLRDIKLDSLPKDSLKRRE